MNPVCLNIRKKILGISRGSGHGHLPSCFSVIEMIYAIYSVMKHTPSLPRDENRDLFVLSKGHAALAQYGVLAHFGYFPIEQVESFGGLNSRFGCHADRTKIPGVEASTGSLGHGLGLAVGMAHAIKLRDSQRQVYVLIGDGESNEGTIWESLMVAENLKLDNLTILLDFNHSQIRGLQIVNPSDRFASFGCQVYDVDGHDVEGLKTVLRQRDSRPKAIVARTEKGHGCRTLMENMFAWHRRAPTDSEFQALMEELHA